MKKGFDLFKYKWLKGNCRHFCKLCKYKNGCTTVLPYDVAEYFRKHPKE